MKRTITFILILLFSTTLVACNSNTPLKGEEIKNAFVGNWKVIEEISKDGETKKTGNLKVIYAVTPTEYKYYLGDAMSMKKRVVYTWGDGNSINTQIFVTSASMGEVSGGKENIKIEIKVGKLYMKTGDGKTTVMEKYIEDIPK